MRKKWFIGVDISKKTLDVVIYDSKKKHSDSANYLKVSNDEEGFNRMLSWFQGKRMSLSGMVIGMESTGIYGFDLRVFLESKGIDHLCLYASGSEALPWPYAWKERQVGRRAHRLLHVAPS